MTTEMRWTAIAAAFLLALGVLVHEVMPRYDYQASTDGSAVMIYRPTAGNFSAPSMTRTGTCSCKLSSRRSNVHSSRARFRWVYRALLGS